MGPIASIAVTALVETEDSCKSEMFMMHGAPRQISEERHSLDENLHHTVINHCSCLNKGRFLNSGKCGEHATMGFF